MAAASAIQRESITDPPAAVSNVADLIRARAATHPDQVAVIDDRRDRASLPAARLTFAELDALIDRTAAALMLAGIAERDKVLMMVKPGIEFVALTFSLFRIKALPVMIDPGMGVSRMLACIRDLAPDALVGIPAAHLVRRLKPGSFRAVRSSVLVGSQRAARLLGAKCLAVLRDRAEVPSRAREQAEKEGSHEGTEARSHREVSACTEPSDPAAILFTSGSTGPPRGVLYEHGMFAAQVQWIQELYGIDPGEVDLSAFPLFALFAPAMGMTSIIPEMDFSQPARVDPTKIISAITRYRVSNIFGSPAMWDRTSRYCVEHAVELATLRRVLIAGAPVSWRIVERVRRCIRGAADVHTPYGATESLPVASISGGELVGEEGTEGRRDEGTGEEGGTEGLRDGGTGTKGRRHEGTERKGTRDFLNLVARTREGAGICVGRPVPHVDLRIIRVTDEPIESWSDDVEVPRGEIGEIIVRGDVVTKEYFNRPDATRHAKIGCAMPEGEAGTSVDADTEGELSHRLLAGARSEPRSRRAGTADANESAPLQPSTCETSRELKHAAQVWHRMGDVGYLDDDGRVWFCGRKAHRVVMASGTLFTIPCEYIFDEHPDVNRCALVGVGEFGAQRAVIIVEPNIGRFPRGLRRRDFARELLDLGAEHEHTREIRTVLFHKSLPVDIRHNAKINREALSLWARRKLR